MSIPSGTVAALRRDFARGGAYRLRAQRWVAAYAQKQQAALRVHRTDVAHATGVPPMRATTGRAAGPSGASPLDAAIGRGAVGIAAALDVPGFAQPLSDLAHGDIGGALTGAETVGVAAGLGALGLPPTLAPMVTQGLNAVLGVVGGIFAGDPFVPGVYNNPARPDLAGMPTGSVGTGRTRTNLE
jgi:hypothetical protein